MYSSQNSVLMKKWNNRFQVIQQTNATQAHSKYVLLNTFLQHRYYVPYCTLRGSFKVKCTCGFNKLPWHIFGYVDIGTYCCVCITLFQVCTAVIHNSNIRGVSLLEILEISPTQNPTLNLPDSVNKCKSDIKTHLLMQSCYFNFLMQIWAVLLNHSFIGFVPELFKLPSKPTELENSCI